MAVSHNREQTPRKKQARLQPWLHRTRYRGVQQAVQNRFLRTFSALLVELQIDVRTTLAIPASERRDYRFHGHGRTADAQNPGPALRQCTRAFAQRFSVGQELAAPRQQIFAALRELYAPAGAVEQAQPERRLEFGNATGQSGLRDVQRRRGRGKAPLVRDHDERTKQAEVHIMRHRH
jgi:hypothetical protein